MLILTEKPSVAKDFALTLGCTKINGFYVGNGIEITNCVGHLYNLFNPEDYDPEFKSWRNIPVLPKNFAYKPNPKTEEQTKLVKTLLKKHFSDDILIATDADREGEVIARECLNNCGITDYSRIKRFWVSEALTPEVINDGLKKSLPLHTYDHLAEKGFARQHSDWLTGINFTRYVTIAADTFLPVGRVQTAILSEINKRCLEIENFTSRKYYEFWGTFGPLKGIYFEDEQTDFPDKTLEQELKAEENKEFKIVSRKNDEKKLNPPQLYNLNAIQKDSFRLYGLSAQKTLAVIQKLYEEYKCVSYPRTPSRVMGTSNAELCKRIFDVFLKDERFAGIEAISDLTIANTNVYDDSKLESHHALIPLKDIPQNSSEIEKKIFDLILTRFMVAFSQPYSYLSQNIVVQRNAHLYKISGIKPLVMGWKNYESLLHPGEKKDTQIIPENIGDNLVLESLTIEEKNTKPPKYYNEASILTFMEHPKVKESKEKLVGLGTQATRHTFIPKLLKSGYIINDKNKLKITELGRSLIDSLIKSPLKSLTDIDSTTKWEEQLENDPLNFENSIKKFVLQVVAQDPNFNIKKQVLSCPKCGGELKKGKSNWFCSKYKEGCDFVIWESVFGRKLSNEDVVQICKAKETSFHTFTSKAGKKYKAKLILDEQFKIKLKFNDTRKSKKGAKHG